MKDIFILLTLFFTWFSYGVFPEWWSESFPSNSLALAETAKEAQALIDKGADVNEKINGHYVLYFAIESNRLGVARVLLENGANLHNEGSYLHMVRSEKMAKLLLEHGADVHIRNHPTDASNSQSNSVLSSVWNNLFNEYISPEQGRSPYREASRIRRTLKKAGAGFTNQIKRCAIAFSH